MTGLMRAPYAVRRRGRWLSVTASACLVGVGLVTAPANAVVYVDALGGPGHHVYTVPAGLTSLTLLVSGGGGGSYGPVQTGGVGAVVQGTIAVTPGEQIDVEIGGRGGDGGATASATGGIGGGGSGGSDPSGSLFAGGGGGATYVSVGGQVLVVAGGGGGASSDHSGGAAGLPGVETTYIVEGREGSPGGSSAGGAAGVGGSDSDTVCLSPDGGQTYVGTSGTDGAVGLGGSGATAVLDPAPGHAGFGGGGGGGGGSYGGGGGGSGAACDDGVTGSWSGGAGGGGSSFVSPEVSDVTTWPSSWLMDGGVSIAFADDLAPAAQPVLTPTPNAAGWAATDVQVAWNWQDGASQVDPSSCQQDTVVDQEGERLTKAKCKDLAGNAGTTSITVRVDKTAPMVVLQRPRPTGYVKGAKVRVSFVCVDKVSGIATCQGSSPTGALLSTGHVGRHTFVVTATDLAGNVGVKKVVYRVTPKPHKPRRAQPSR